MSRKGPTPPAKPRQTGSNGSCPDEPETSTAFFESEGPLRSLLFMNTLRQSGKLCDARLRVNETIMSAHRLVLAASSSYFAEVFTGDAEFSTDQVLDLSGDDLDEESLETLLEFAYTKTVHLSQANVHRLFSAADCLRFAGLKEACFRYLLRILDIDNCLGMWTFACGHDGERGGLEDTAFELVKKNFKDVAVGAAFLELSFDGLAAILRNDDLAVEAEEQVYAAAVGWLRHDAAGREGRVGDVMACIRLPLIELDYLTGTVQDEPLVRSSQRALDALIKAIDYKQQEVQAGRSPRATLLNMSFDEHDMPVQPRRPSMLLEEIQITKKHGARLGLSIMGGKDRPGHVFVRGDRPGCLVNGILASGAAASSALRVGDRILSVNGHNLEALSHDQNVALLSKSRDTITLVVRHEDPPVGLKEFTLKTNRGEGFGFSISGGVNSAPGNPESSNDEGIFVMRVLAGGAADKGGHVKVGQRILQVNSISMHGATHAEALQATRQSVDCLTLMVCDGFNADGYVSPQELDSREKDRKLRSLITRKSMIFDPSACVSY